MTHKIFCGAILGLQASLVEIEADQGGGEFGRISIVGLPDTSVNESRERVRSAIKNSGYTHPKRKITVNLAPASLKKHGSHYDLAIALAIIGLKHTPPEQEAKRCFVVGELSLSGNVKATKSVLPLASLAARNGFREIYVPAQNAAEAAIIPGLEVYPISSLREIAGFLFEGKSLHIKPHIEVQSPEIRATENIWQKINGQVQAKRAAEIALAGGHHLLLIGPPGSGKTMIAKAMAASWPLNNWQTSLELAHIKSVVGLKNQADQNFFHGLFRAVHHSSSLVALLGGGRHMKPGEISLSHGGLLFLDELTAFAPATINALRQPLEENSITISHANEIGIFPCNFTLIAAANPCPCGFYGDPTINCHCRPKQLLAYQRRIPGPILDRLDLRIHLTRPSSQAKQEYQPSDASIKLARKIQTERGFLNGRCPDRLLQAICHLGHDEAVFFENALKKLSCSERAKTKTLKVARTIADLEGAESISINHLAEALSLRSEDTICYN